MKLNKINFKSKGFATLVACVVLSAFALVMVAISQSNQNSIIKNTTTSVADVRADVDGVKKATKPTLPTTGASGSSSSAESSSAQENSEASTMPSMTANDTNVPYKSYYRYPINEVVTKDYSGSNLVYSMTMGDYRSHNGTDFNGKEGDSVKSINDGIVLTITKDELWGTVVEVDHGSKMIAKYCGIKTTNLKVGIALKSGDTIGTLGAIPIESADGSHLHLEIRIDNKIVNPIEAMNKLNKE